MEKQRGLTDRIKNYESRQSDTAMTLQMSIDQTSSFNPEISITQYTDRSLLVQHKRSSLDQQSIEHSLQSSQKQSQVHNLYTKLISKDLTHSKEKTQAQLAN